MIIAGATIYTEKESLPKASLIIDRSKIKTILAAQELNGNVQDEVMCFPENYHIIPGMIDLHIHGLAGADVMDATPKALQTICQHLPQEGTTAFLATTMTQAEPNIKAALLNVKNYLSQPNKTGAEILGVHLEGPFLSPKQMGAQQARYIIEPNVKLLKKWQLLTDNIIKQVSFAPEQCSDDTFINYLIDNQIIAALGHTDANYEQASAAIKAGCTHATHLCNAMRGLHHRELGTVGAILMSSQTTAELIVDGIHIHPAMLEFIYQIKGCEKLVLVTDAIRAKCLVEGVYDLGGQQVTVAQNTARLANGALAGSLLKMLDAANNMRQFVGCDLRAVIKMTAENPAKLLNMFARKGSLAPGKDADLLVLDDKYKLILTMCRGEIVYNAAEQN